MPAISHWIMTLTKIQNWGDHMKDIVLSCDNLLKQYPVKKGMFNKVVGQKNIVDHVSLELEKGQDTCDRRRVGLWQDGADESPVGN